MEIPLDSSIAQSTTLQREQNKAEQEQLKRLVLDYESREEAADKAGRHLCLLPRIYVELIQARGCLQLSRNRSLVEVSFSITGVTIDEKVSRCRSFHDRRHLEETRHFAEWRQTTISSYFPRNASKNRIFSRDQCHL